MRAAYFLLPLSLMAAPAIAQPSADAPIAVPKELTDPAFAERLTAVMRALSKSFLELPVGEVEAAIEGRAPTAADRKRTVRSEGEIDERELNAQIEAARPMMQASLKAMAAALPAMMQGLTEASKELEKATANLPQPGYPKR